MASLLEAARWERRGKGFGPVRAYRDADARSVVAIELAPAVPVEDQVGWFALAKAWAALPPHPNILEAIARDGDVVLLRFPAIDWLASPLPDDGTPPLPTAGVHLCDALAHVIAHVPAHVRGAFARPFVHRDVDGQPRIGFWPLARPPKLDERAAVAVVGSLVESLRAPGGGGPVAALLAKSWKTLAQLRAALVAANGRPYLARSGETLDAWLAIEQGFGRFALGELVEAHLRFSRRRGFAAFGDLRRDVAEETMRAIAAKQRGEWPIADFGALPPIALTGERWWRDQTPPRERAAAASSSVARRWADAAPLAREREQARDFAGALDIYATVIADPATDAARFAARAHCALHLGGIVPARRDAAAALAAAGEPWPLELVVLAIEAALATDGMAPRNATEALLYAEILVARAPESGSARYLRGKALLALDRLHEAREELDLASRWRPSLTAAMLLRREADRAIGAVRAAVGVEDLQAPREDALAAMIDSLEWLAPAPIEI